MAIAISEIKGSTARFSLGGQRYLTRSYKAWSTSGPIDNWEVRAKFPLTGTPDVDDPGCRLKEVNIQPGDGPRVCDVSLTFDTQTTQQDQENEAQELAPWEAKATWNISWRQEQKVLYKDYSDPPKLVLNSAGQLFADPVVGWKNIMILNVQNNIATPNWSQLRDYQNAVNSDVFLGGEPETLKMPCSLNGPSYKQTPNRVFEYYQAQWVFEYNGEGWEEDILDMGMDEKGSDGKPVRIKDISSPVRLDGKGKRLADGAEPVYLEFKRYKAKPFQTLINNLNFVW